MKRRRPLLPVFVSFSVGILLGRACEPACSISLLTILTLLLVTLTALSLVVRRLRPLSVLFLFGICAALGALLYTNARFPTERLSEHVDKIQHIQGVVVSYPDHGPERTRFVLKPKNTPGYLQVFYDHTRDPEYFHIDYSDELVIRSRLRVPQNPDDEDFDYREYLKRRDIWGIVWVYRESQVQIVARRRGSAVLQLGYDLRQELFARLTRHLPQQESSLLKGLLFGERESLPKEIEANFRDAGVMHVLAVSGANLGMILALLALMLSWWGFNFSRLYLFAFPIVLLYLLVVGFEVSLVRATLMFFFVTLGYFFGERGWILKRWADPLQGLAAAALVILLLDPEALFEVGFQLSFVATLAILISVLSVWPAVRDRGRLAAPEFRQEPWGRRLVYWLVLFVLVSLAAQLGVAPVIGYHFHRVYLWGAILGNLVIIPLVTVALWGGILLLTASALPISFIASFLGQLEGLLLGFIIRLSEFFANLPGAIWSF
jgi:competence protein ComEC